MSTRTLENGNELITAEVTAARTDTAEWRDATVRFTAAIPPPERPDHYRDIDMTIEVEGTKRDLSFSLSPRSAMSPRQPGAWPGWLATKSPSRTSPVPAWNRPGLRSRLRSTCSRRSSGSNSGCSWSRSSRSS